MRTCLKIGVIGCGGVAQMMHLPFLANRPDLFQIEAVCDVDPVALAAVAALYHVPQRFADYRDLLALPLDAVLILSADPHSPQVIAAAQAGKHILVEKPLAVSLQELDAIGAAVQTAGVQLMVANMKRYDPAYAEAQRLLAGRTDLRHAQITVWHPDDAAYRTHYTLTPAPLQLDRVALPDEMGVCERTQHGAIADLIDLALGPDRSAVEQRIGYWILASSIVHQINALRGLLGEPEEVLSTHIWYDGRGVQSTLRYSHQLLVTLTWLYLPGIKHYQEKYLFLAPEMRLELEFPSPYLRHFPTGLRIEGMERGMAYAKDVVVSYAEAFHEELLHFHHCVTTGATPRTGIDEARGDTRLAIAMAKAFRSR